MKLYQLSAEYERLSQIDDEDANVDAALADLNDALEVKAERIGYVLRNLAADEVALSTEIQRLTARREQVDRQRERIRRYVLECMQAGGIRKIQCPSFTISLSESQPHVVVDDFEKLPDNYVRTKREADKQAILRAFKEHGEVVPGTRVERGTSLRMR